MLGGPDPFSPVELVVLSMIVVGAVGLVLGVLLAIYAGALRPLIALALRFQRKVSGR